MNSIYTEGNQALPESRVWIYRRLSPMHLGYHSNETPGVSSNFDLFYHQHKGQQLGQ
jgi:hypothetical protein